MKSRLTLALFVPLIMYLLILLLTTNPQWVLTMFSIGLAYGSLSYLISIRRLFYLAEASPHIALFLFTISTLILGFYGLETLFLSVSIGTLVMIILGVKMSGLRDHDKNISLLIGLSASLNVLVLYFSIRFNPRGFSLSALFIGDPLLTTTRDVLATLAIAVLTSISITLTLREQLITSIDREFAKISNIKTWFYDSLAYTLLAVNTIGLIRVTGFILQHVLALMPPIAISMVKRDLWTSYLLTIVSTIYASLLSLNASLLIGVPPSGIIGLIYTAYIVITYMKR